MISIILEEEKERGQKQVNEQMSKMRRNRNIGQGKTWAMVIREKPYMMI